MRFSTLYGSPQGCTCYDNKNSQCAPNYWCNECRNNPSNPNCNMRVGNRVVPRYQTQSGIGGIYATPTNRFRNVVEFMPMGTDNGGFSMPMGISERANFQNANGSAEEIGGGRQGNPTRGLYAVEINSPTPIGADKLLYNTLVNAMSNQGLTIPPFFSPKLINKGYRRGNYSYLFEIRDGFRASNFVQDKMLPTLPFKLKGKIPINYTATFISGYLHSPKGGGGKPIGGGGFNSAVGMGNPTVEFMPMGTDNGGFSMPMGISERANFQNANGSAEEIGGGRQGNPTRGLYAVEINSPTPIGADKLLYNTLVNAMSNQGLTIPPFFSPKLINKGYRRGNYSYLFEIRDGFRASNFVQDKMLPTLPFKLKGKIPINYTATFISGYLHSPKGGGGKPIGGGGFNSAVGMGNPTMVAPAFGGTKTPSSGINNYCIKCLKKGCGCIKDERGRPRCDCGELTPSGTRLNNFCKRHPELCSGII